MTRLPLTNISCYSDCKWINKGDEVEFSTYLTYLSNLRIGLTPLIALI